MNSLKNGKRYPIVLVICEVTSAIWLSGREIIFAISQKLKSQWAFKHMGVSLVTPTRLTPHFCDQFSLHFVIIKCTKKTFLQERSACMRCLCAKYWWCSCMKYSIHWSKPHWRGHRTYLDNELWILNSFRTLN